MKMGFYAVALGSVALVAYSLHLIDRSLTPAREVVRRKLLEGPSGGRRNG